MCTSAQSKVGIMDYCQSVMFAWKRWGVKTTQVEYICNTPGDSFSDMYAMSLTSCAKAGYSVLLDRWQILLQVRAMREREARPLAHCFRVKLYHYSSCIVSVCDHLHSLVYNTCINSYLLRLTPGLRSSFLVNECKPTTQRIWLASKRIPTCFYLMNR